MSGNDGNVYAVDGRTGHEFWKRATWNDAVAVGADRELSVGSILSPPPVVAGTVYFGSADGSLYAIE